MRFAPRARFSRLVLLLLCVIPMLVGSAKAQVAGRNVNMVTGGSFPGGDPFLQKQNEPSLAMSTRNPCHLLAGANDYRAVNLPGLPADKEVGDAWPGWYESTDCGATWYSTLVPGYLQDASPAGLASPVKGLGAGADPVVRSGAAGTFYYLFIAFNRGSNVGKLALARGIDHNDREAFVDPNAQPISIDGTSNPRRALSPIQYVGTTEMARGSGGQFIDKPSLAVFPAASGTCVMDGETVPATNVYTAWTEFIGNGAKQHSKVSFARSADCGKTLAGPATKLSEGFPLGQGTAIAVNPNNPNDIYVVWRQIRSDHGQDALLYARSTDGGRSFTKAEFIPGLGEGQFAPFDQNTTSKARGNLTTTFRTIAYPTLAFADDGYLYLAVSQVPPGFYTPNTLGGAQARIYMTRANNAGWQEQPIPVVADVDAAGQQFMPALAYAAGKMQLVWYDVRFDEAFDPAEQFNKPLIDDVESLQIAARRRTIDLLGAQATFSVANGVVSTAWPPAFARYGVSQPDYDSLNSPIPARGPRISQYLVGDPNPAVNQTPAGPRQLLFNRGGLPLYGGGTIPFMGDYIDVASIPFVINASGRWVFNGAANAAKASLQTFQAAWTDNRDATIGKAATETLPGNPPIVRYKYETPLALNGGVVSAASCPVPGVDNTRSRDANVYTSRITQDFSFTAPSNTKHGAPGVIRAFAVQLANNRELDPTVVDLPTTYQLKLDPGARASFSRDSFQSAGGTCVAAPNATPIREITVEVLPRSSVARTVYVPCGTTGPIAVTATDTSTGATGSLLLNADAANPQAKGPQGATLGPESHNPDAENPDAENPDAENPDAENPDAENPDAENPDAENPDAENPDAENPDAENPDAENPDAENPDAENPDAENSTFQDVTTDITNTGNTTSGYQVVVNTADATAGYQFLLMANRVYSTQTSINCHLVKQNNNQQLFAIPLSGDDLNSGNFYDENSTDVRNATVLIRPGETIRVKMRIVWNAETTEPFCQPGQCHDKLQFRTRALAPNTGSITPTEVSEGNLNSSFLSFQSGPADASTTAPIGGNNDGPITVRAIDATDAPVPGVPITMSLGNNPGNAALGGTVTQTTNALGEAVFSTLTIGNAAVGYTLVASAPDAGSVASNPFDVVASVGSVTDPTGDAGGGPDLTSATITVNQGNLNISVRYAAGTFNATSTLVNLVLDIDENPATGSPGVDSGCANDATSMGTDFIINTGGAIYGEGVFVFPHSGGQTCNSYGAPSNVGTRTVVADGVDFVVPLSALGNDAGRLKFKVLSATTTPDVCPTCSTGVQDYMTDVGLAPGQVPSPVFY